MIDLRYLSLTLMGVFLALAVGIMVGYALGSPERRDAAYDRLRHQHEELANDNRRVEEENGLFRRRLDARDQAVRELIPARINGKLSGQDVAVVLCGSIDERPFWNELRGLLENAGARIGPVVRIPDRLRDLDPELRSRLVRIWGQPDDLVHARPYEVAGWLIHALARAHSQESLRHFSSAPGIEITGEAHLPVHRLLLLTTASDELREASVRSGDIPEISIIDAARADQLRLVIAEPEDSRISVVDSLRVRDVTTVDNINSPLGQLSSVFALSGADGHFGSKPGAARPIPPLESPAP
jgi:hypothetical protein